MSENMKKGIKCKLKDSGYYEWCNAMDKFIYQEANASVKGLVQVNLFNFKTGKESCLGVVYRDGASNKAQKCMLNVCPWCGEEILNESKLKRKEHK